MASRIFRPQPLGRLRLAELDDISTIHGLVNESMSKNFRISTPSDIGYLIENCVLSICQLDVNEVIVGFLAARDYPVVPALHPGAWEDFIWTKYKAIELNARNTLFIHMLCWNPVYAREIVDNMLKSIFMNDPYVQHIAMMKSVISYPLLVPGQSRSEGSFRRVQALERGVSGDMLPALCVADRTEVCPRLRIRRAVEEDNDDIVPIIEHHSVRLRQLYGDFYVSELISRHPESERVLLVCEHKEVAVGVMCLNTQINFEALEDNFELSPFAGLRHLDRQPYYKRSKDIDSTFSLLASNTVFEMGPESVSSFEPSTFSKDTKVRVTWQFTEDEFNKLKAEGMAWDQDRYGTFTQLDVLNLLEEDEEELEFDIVNIDTDLLRLPRLLSHDELMKKDEGLMDDIAKVLDSRKHRDSLSDIIHIKDKKEKKLPSILSSTSQTKTPEPTRYSGSPNAFLLELFAMHQDYDDRYGFDMLEAAYELFPGRDYCIMCLPSSHTCFPLLEHFTLVTPYSYKMRFVNDTLYVAHVNAIRGEIRVRQAEEYDIPNLNNVLEHTPRKQDLLDLFDSSLVSNILTSYVLLSQNQPVGFVILGPLEEGTLIRTQYNLNPDPRRFGTDANILAGVMSPIMEVHGRWFLRDLLRQSRYTTLFWVCRLFARGESNPIRNLMSLAGHMMPVRPRRFVPNISRNRELELLFKEITTPFALWSLERPLTSLPRIYVNNSIVVVGASRTGLAFLEALLSGPTAEYLTFTNITLISEHGLPTVSECLRAADTCVPRDGRYTDRYIKTVPFYFYLDVMSAVMVKIDRKRKCVHLKGGGLKFYDELVLTCGLQFQHPEYLKESLEVVKEVEKGKPCDRILMDNPNYQPDRVPPSPDMPDNVMLINSLYQANVYLRKLLKMVSEAKETSLALSSTNPIIVYGDCVEAYTCIAAVIELGLAAGSIIFVEPFPPGDATALRINCFNNETVDERVQASLDKLGVQVYRKCEFSGWRLTGSRVETIRFMAPLHAIHLSCFALFYCGRRDIDIHSFKAINESGLVYDGGLVVGRSFETNDPHVWGAGPCTRYSRRLHAAPHLHKYYSSEDVGEALARMFLRKLDPFLSNSPDLDSSVSEHMLRHGSSISGAKSSHASFASSRISINMSKNRWQPVSKFDSPIYQYATLPGPLYYMRLRKPGREVPMAVQLLLPHQGHTLITDKRGNYFRLQLNVLHCVESITCLSKKPFCSDIFAQLYGKHEAFFNKLLTRFKMNMIDDLYDYFTKPFMSALYQESFTDLMNELHEQEIATVYDVVKTKFHEFHDDVKLKTKSFESTIPLSCLESSHCKIETEKPIKKKATDIPSECGQNEAPRHEAATFWKAVGGENIVVSRLGRYFVRNSVTNPHYAVPDLDLK
ncbi:cilia- and flagella-associated protein 61-like [Epargyreus clarus]|uniref:cilia- and flagella-associated protein 61-like n=1 Tax=Epargyreus clarus TaxID=520877 RepID=UPI003C2B468C